MRSLKQTLARLLIPIVAGAFCMIAMMSAMTAFAEWRDDTPQIGDVVTFHTIMEEHLPVGQRLNVNKQDRSSCVLELETILRTGGSLMVEKFNGLDQHYLIHWAGVRTSRDGTDCGDSADLVVDREQLDLLQAAAALSKGGGVRVRVFSPFEAT